MSHTTVDEETTPQGCLAIPNAARRGWRSDHLCASVANTEVAFCGRRVAVCRIHQATYARWGAAAEARAIELWSWKPDPQDAGARQ